MKTFIINHPLFVSIILFLLSGVFITLTIVFEQIGYIGGVAMILFGLMPIVNRIIDSEDSK